MDSQSPPKHDCFPFSEMSRPRSKNHKCPWKEIDKNTATEYLKLRGIPPHLIEEQHARMLNQMLGRSLTAESWRRTVKRWTAQEPVSHRSSDVAIELQELRETSARVERLRSFLRKRKENGNLRYEGGIILAYLEADDLNDFFDAVAR